jgi:nucleoid DNA-binding protein
MKKIVRSKPLKKRELLSKVAKDTGVDVNTVAFIYDTIFAHMLRGVERLNDIILPGIGRIGFLPHRQSKSNITGTIIPKHRRLKCWFNARLAYEIRKKTREII